MGHLPDAASNIHAGSGWAIRLVIPTRRATSARRVAPAALGNQPGMIWGESVDAVRTASEEAWAVFLRDFKRWCISEEAKLLLLNVPQPAKRATIPSRD